MPKKKQQPKESSKSKRSTSGSAKPQGGVGRGILETATTTTARKPQPITSWGWDKEFKQLVEFHRENPGKWPLRDSRDPKEVWLANWFRGNLELYWARRLNAARTNMILNLIEGRYDLPVKAGKPKGSKAGKQKAKRA